MGKQKTITGPDWIFEEIESRKPKNITMSEWMVQLMYKGLHTINNNNYKDRENSDSNNNAALF